MRINIIGAVCKNNGIGYNNTLPWHFSKDLAFFSRKTRPCTPNSSTAVIMGRSTWNGLPKRLPYRSNYILSREVQGEGFFNSLDKCLDHCRENKYSSAWIIGGENLYKQALVRDDINNLYLTRIMQEFICDTHFPLIPKHYQCIERVLDYEKNTCLMFETYENTKNASLTA